MREILFRGKRTDNGEWVYGVPTKDNRGETVIVESVFECDEYNCRGANCLYVDEKTVGQYTGLTDKNGKKIFEGDIIDIQYPDTFVANTVVEYVGASFVASTDYDDWVLDDFVSLEVIGNIHDNPELLKGE